MIKGLEAIAITLGILAVAGIFQTARETWPQVFVRFRLALVSTLAAGLIVLTAWHFCGA
jgi:hypothetical protein